MRARYQRGPAVSGARGGAAAGWSWRTAVSMRRAYGLVPDLARQPVGDRLVAGAAWVVAVGCWWHDVRLVAGCVVAVVLVLDRHEPRVRAMLVLTVLAATAVVRAAAAWDGLTPSNLGTYEGAIALVDDPQPYGAATRVIVEIEGERFELWARGRAIQLRVATWRAGESVLAHGQRRALKPERQARVAWQHVVGEFRIDWVSDVRPGSPVSTASNRVRAALERAASELPADDGALFRGLVVGDDRDQPREMIERFRASGLSHLTAVSGQNVSFVLMAAAPLLRVLRPWLLIDPLLVWSVGFWLSVGATWGVAALGPRLAERLSVLRFLATPIGVTLGAQVGVVVPAVMVFGRLPLVSIPANLLAVPVAGFVMLYGLPAGLLAGAVPAVAPVVMFPCRVGVRWVDTVSVLGARSEPGGTATWVGWGVLVVVVGAIAAMNRGRHGSPSADR